MAYESDRATGRGGAGAGRSCRGWADHAGPVVGAGRGLLGLDVRRRRDRPVPAGGQTRAPGAPRLTSGTKPWANWNGVIVACFLLGAAMGGLIFGWLGDRIGRVRAMVLSILVYSIFTGAGAFATQAWHLGVFRFIASLGMGGEWAVAVALVVECWPEKHRPMLAGAIGAAANFGFLFIGIVAAIFPVIVGLVAVAHARGDHPGSPGIVRQPDRP